MMKIGVLVVGEGFERLGVVLSLGSWFGGPS